MSILSIASLGSLQRSSAKPTPERPSPSFSLPATLKALSHPQGALDALRHLHKLPRAQREVARDERLTSALERIALSESYSLTARVWSLSFLERLKIPAQAMRALISQTTQPPSSKEALLLARVSAGSLRALGRADLLTEALKHADPEVRASAAAVGASPTALCELLTTEPWPFVRYEATRGLERVGGAVALCVSEAIDDEDERVQARAAQALGALALDSSWRPTQEQRSLALKALTWLAGEARAPLNARESAFVGLAQWGSLLASERALKAHLSKGGITPLALASLRAVMSSTLSAAERFERLEPVLKESPSLEVRLAAARCLAQLKSAEAEALLERQAERVGGREGRHYLKLLGRDPQGALERGELKMGPQAPELAPTLDEEDRLGL